jgi:protein subunit release factor B
MDWTSMVLKMYTSWAARKKFSRTFNSFFFSFFFFFCSFGQLCNDYFSLVEVLHQSNGDVGIKSVSCKLSGDYAYLIMY